MIRRDHDDEAVSAAIMYYSLQVITIISGMMVL